MTEEDRPKQRPDTLNIEFQENVYAALYDYANDYARSNALETILPKEAFIRNTEQHPMCVNTELFESLDNKTFIQAVFWSLLSRVPNQHEMAVWETRAARQTTEKFRRRLALHLMHSHTARLKRIQCVFSSFDDLNQIDYYRNFPNSLSAVQLIFFYVSVYGIDRVVSMLHYLYGIFIRPARNYLRYIYKNRRAPGKSGKSA